MSASGTTNQIGVRVRYVLRTSVFIPDLVGDLLEPRTQDRRLDAPLRRIVLGDDLELVGEIAIRGQFSYHSRYPSEATAAHIKNAT